MNKELAYSPGGLPSLGRLAYLRMKPILLFLSLYVTEKGAPLPTQVLQFVMASLLAASNLFPLLHKLPKIENSLPQACVLSIIHLPVHLPPPLKWREDYASW